MTGVSHRMVLDALTRGFLNRKAMLVAVGAGLLALVCWLAWDMYAADREVVVSIRHTTPIRRIHLTVPRGWEVTPLEGAQRQEGGPVRLVALVDDTVRLVGRRSRAQLIVVYMPNHEGDSIQHCARLSTGLWTGGASRQGERAVLEHRIDGNERESRLVHTVQVRQYELACVYVKMVGAKAVYGVVCIVPSDEASRPARLLKRSLRSVRVE